HSPTGLARSDGRDGETHLPALHVHSGLHVRNSDAGGPPVPNGRRVWGRAVCYMAPVGRRGPTGTDRCILGRPAHRQRGGRPDGSGVPSVEFHARQAAETTTAAVAATPPIPPQPGGRSVPLFGGSLVPAGGC